MCNEAVADTGHAQVNASSIQIMRVSNASGSYEDVVLRPKTGVQHHRLARSLAAISGLFKTTHRHSGTNQQKKNGGNVPNESSHVKHRFSNGDTEGMKRRKIWNFFKLKEKLPRNDDVDADATPSFQHFQEPLNFERPSLVGGDINSYCDAEWYDLNKVEMSLFEERLSNVVSEFRRYNISTKNGSGCGVSTNVLRSHNNLSRLCVSNGENDIPEIQNHFEIKQSIQPKKPVRPLILIDNNITTKAIDVVSNCDFNESCKISSGFGSSESNTNSPQEFARRFKEFSNSPATSDFFEAAFSSVQSNVSNECVPITGSHAVTGVVNSATASQSNVKNMQKTSKNSHIQINSKRLFGMLYGKHTLSPPVNTTPQNKSPMNCRTKKVRNGTPFKIRPTKENQMHVATVASQRLFYPLKI